jgi:hypothetical protein
MKALLGLAACTALLFAAWLVCCYFLCIEPITLESPPEEPWSGSVQVADWYW